MHLALPNHLSQRSATGVQLGEPIAQFEIGPMQNFVYLVIDWQERACAWVDPQKDLSAPLEVLRKHSLKLERILLTHTHHDHIAGIVELARLYPEAPIHLGELDRHRLPAELRQSPRLQPLQDGEEFQIGEIPVQTIATPGHSAGALSYLIQTAPPYLLSGDTIFIRDCGRTDLPTGSTSQLFESLQRVRKLPPQTILLPGHHYAPETASFLESEWRSSPPFQCQTVIELEELP